MKSVESVDYMEQAPRALPFLNSDKIECNLVHWLPEILILMVLFGCFVRLFFFFFLVFCELLDTCKDHKPQKMGGGGQVANVF